ncbi:SAM-dependent methyltransferase [Gluconobacter oxydans]|uniref:Cyclopropane-fatty-acyl-phospholipid synthase n=2 Tax=Gluconobacter oxydans TaxID=442 RepID=Q5FU60_GLUOX|nr:cyclopropane-fatty-acyl-phospholipid synthase family protein [Gluconobacter oxydans]AAW60086.1 Cyclopropane-fatty-acyl-phospholipid synthase [Gluconobacter oxydans 621H]KXV30307.1 cyclopropane-fatty-acyl-phospholipid synthase [Gluconobacter oxydans]MBF0855429.1 class I SAM-dependent methyltransferase [Gluconobacter oxydans]TCW28334.1 cyclopropane-fatty-acyl-phospholipid synthase [Gluconobacter oxydans]GEC59965.1 cyclopropane-fatty-acyl-phospholipid synthase [Gluconobacter oxydans]
MKRILDFVLRKFIQTGSLRVTFSDGTVRTYRGRKPGLEAGLQLLNKQAERALIINSGLAFGEEYMAGSIVPDGCTLETLLTVLMENINGHGHVFEEIEDRLRYVTRAWKTLNSLKKSRSNVAHHYDLNGTLYDLFLDKDRQYSCAYFAREDMTLEEAQIAKKRHIASKLNLDRPGFEVLDIGCGWGGMALTLAKDYGAKVLGITLSREQLEVARKRAKEEGLEGQVRFELIDYRNLHQQFDRIVSVGMFEHVGPPQFEAFFKQLKACLKPDGVALIHSIGRMDGPGTTNPWIQKYIFPGGYSPALSETLAAIERSGLWMTDCEVLRLHYARTLAEWRKRFDANRDKIRALYDERFVRMFEFYLVGAELAFRVQGHMNFQLQLTRSIDAVPFTRDYMFERERESATS